MNMEVGFIEVSSRPFLASSWVEPLFSHFRRSELNVYTYPLVLNMLVLRQSYKNPPRTYPLQLHLVSKSCGLNLAP